jgi:adenosylhomocysteine nucleosidase
MIAIITAMEAEFMEIQQRMLVDGRTEQFGDGFWRGTLKNKDIVAIKSGIGKENTVTAMKSLLDKSPLRLIISTGVAGALSPDLISGDVIIGEKILSRRGETFFSDRNMLNVCIISCKKLGLRHFSSVILTVSEFVTSINEKMKLHKEYGALAVEMESAFIARYAVERGIPFLAVRIISDRADTSFKIDFQRIKRGGRIDPWKFFIYFFMHPILFLEFRIHRKTLALSASHLSDLIGEIIGHIN